jgi:simple sugar transport system substrate-binding protein
MPTVVPSITAMPTVAGTPSPQYPGMSVGFVQTDMLGGWRLLNTHSFGNAAIASGVQLSTRFAYADFSKAVSIVKDFIADPTINVIVIAPVVASGWDSVLKAAKAAGKPVIIEDMMIDSNPSLYSAWVGPDMVAEGQKAATAMCTLLKDAKAKNVLEVAGSASQAAVGRAKGFRQNMGSCGMTIKATRSGDWDQAKAQTVTSAYLATDKNVQAIFVQNDTMALGAIEAIKGAGLTPGKDIQVVGIDGTSDGFRAMIAGELGADVDCNPDLAPQVYKAAWDAMQGIKGPSFIAGPDVVFYASQGPDALEEILAGREY